MVQSKGLEALHNQTPTAGIYIHKLDKTKDYFSNETKEYLPSKQNTSYCSAKQDVSGLCLNKEGTEIEYELVNQIQTHNYASQEVIPTVHSKSNVCKQNKPGTYPLSQDVANSKLNENAIVSNIVANLPLVDSSITDQHPNNECLQYTPGLVKQSKIPHQPTDQQLNKGYFRKHHRTRPPQIQDQNAIVATRCGFNISCNTIHQIGSNIWIWCDE
jgi:hypothetical protein